MERALFVARRDSTKTRELLREAGDIVGGVDGTLFVLHVMPESEYEQRAESRRESGALQKDGSEYSTYPITQAESDAREFAERMGDDVLTAGTVEWEPLGTVGREGRSILEVADDRDVDHLFVVGEQRSPSGKAIFGDLAQRLIIEFDGPVTTVVPDER
ncbi:Nucleotide-binding protein, UspA family [Halanaeroarchaeum sp. HSR-CO]|uniref:universal stress protein n=1 Tax=Halanaeroarchaeum sp. HSR-CO TaxID=2866382 RepID=UPI00217ED47F|nr:universal stress protein [Halanaeroarchaeum sp. HSR-CO]UWG48670.1 Nucleotide-binding protein, UspA family [Halanaeroarchaeum sp. HSR-CO]